MFRRVPAAHDYLPIATTDGDGLQVCQPAKTLRQGINRPAKVAEFALVEGQLLLVIARRPVKAQRHLGRRSPGIANHGPAHQELLPGHPQLGTETLGEPAGKAHVVGVHMGADHTRDRPACHDGAEQLLPQLACTVEIQAGIHDGPAIAVGQQPEIDMVQRHGHGKAYPVDALGNLLGLTGRRVDRPTPGVGQSFVEFGNVWQHRAARVLALSGATMVSLRARHVQRPFRELTRRSRVVGHSRHGCFTAVVYPVRSHPWRAPVAFAASVASCGRW